MKRKIFAVALLIFYVGLEGNIRADNQNKGDLDDQYNKDKRNIQIASNEYSVYVRRIDDNLYRDDNSGVIIKTSLCLELSLGEKAILIYDGSNHYACGKLIFLRSGRSCQVDAVYAP